MHHYRIHSLFLLLLFLEEGLRAEDRLEDVFLRAELPFDDVFLRADFFGGTLSPSLRASDSAIATACLRLFTVLPEPPLFKVPCLRSCITLRTLLCVFLPYLAMQTSMG